MIYRNAQNEEVKFPLTLDPPINGTATIQKQSWLSDKEPADYGLTGPHEIVKPTFDADTQKLIPIASGEYEVQDRTLEDAKERKKQTINRIKAEKQLAGFTYDSMTFQSDEVSISRIHATWSYAKADPEYTQPFILQDNSTVTLTNAQCIGLGYAVGQFVAGVTFTARQLKDAILAAETVNEVRAISWPD